MNSNYDTGTCIPLRINKASPSAFYQWVGPEHAILLKHYIDKILSFPA